MRASTLLEDYLEYITDVLNFAPSTVRNYRFFLNLYTQHVKDTPIQDIELKDVDDYFAMRKRQGKTLPSGERQDFSLETLKWERSIIRSFFRYVDRYRKVRLQFDYAMIRGIKAGKPRVNFAKVDDIQRMVAALTNQQDKLILITGFCAGMRISELCDFKVDDFNDDEIVIKGKGKKDRVIPITGELSIALEEHIRNNNLSTGPVFRHQINSGKHNGKFSTSGLRKRFQRQLGPLYKNPHSWRHGGATALLDGGMNLRQLQVFLGHEHLSSTERYTHVTNPGLRRAYKESFPEVSFLD